MFRAVGKVREVEDGVTARGAFGDEPALRIKIESAPESDYLDWILIPDTPSNRKSVKVGTMFDAPVTVRAVATKSGAFLGVSSGFRAAE